MRRRRQLSSAGLCRRKSACASWPTKPCSSTLRSAVASGADSACRSGRQWGSGWLPAPSGDRHRDWAVMIALRSRPESRAQGLARTVQSRTFDDDVPVCLSVAAAGECRLPGAGFVGRRARRFTARPPSVSLVRGSRSDIRRRFLRPTQAAPERRGGNRSRARRSNGSGYGVAGVAEPRPGGRRGRGGLLCPAGPGGWLFDSEQWCAQGTTSGRSRSETLVRHRPPASWTGRAEAA